MAGGSGQFLSAEKSASRIAVYFRLAGAFDPISHVELSVVPTSPFPSVLPSWLCVVMGAVVERNCFFFPR